MGQGSVDRRPINLAFVGTGGWARSKHFPALGYLLAHPDVLPGVELNLQGLYSLEQETAEAVAAHYGFGRVYQSLDALMGDDAVNAIAVAVLPEATASVVSRLAARHVPILSEKPPGVTLVEAQQLAEVTSLPNLVAFNRRFAPLNNQFRDLIGTMPNIAFVEGHFLRYERHDPAFMVHTAIHWINFMEYVFGDIVEVSADAFHDPASATLNAVAHVTFAGGLKGMLKVIPCSGSEAERLEVHSAGQSVYFTGPYGDETGQITVERNGVCEKVVPVVEPTSPEIVRIGIVGEYVEFLTLTCAGRPVRSTFQNAVNSLRVAEAMQKEGEGTRTW